MEVGAEVVQGHCPPSEADRHGQDCSSHPYGRGETRRGFDYYSYFHHSPLLLEWELSDSRQHFCTGPF